MAKVRKNRELEAEAKGNVNQPAEPFTNCDGAEGYVSLPVSQNDIERMIITIRGQQVLIDRDLASLYRVETKSLNQAVKRNPDRFPQRFRFQLTKEETQEVVTKCDHLSVLRFSHVMPYAFTEQGVAMLATVLRGEVAATTSVLIMDAFVGMRRYLMANAHVFQRLDRLEMQQLENRQWMQATDNRIDAILDKMEERQPALPAEQLFAQGCVWDAWAYVSELIRTATKSVTLIDNFVDDRVLSLLSKRADGVSATIHTRYTEQLLTDLKKHNEQYPEIRFVQLPHRNHDRFLIIDDTVYLLGTSLKDMGLSLCAITRLMVSAETILALLK